MMIDIAFVIVMLLAIFKGLRKGLILGIFSLLAFIIGLAAALKLSVVVAEWLKDSAGSFSKWLPLISFMLVFIAVIFLVGLLARVIKKTMQFAMLGWLDSLGGMLLYVIIYTIIFSIFLFFAVKLFLIQPATVQDSNLYPYVSPWGPKVMDNLGKIIPVFKDMFTELQDFFGSMAKKSG
ncbi:MAG TPA: CvpA family protein [Chitinophagaceae bacterium]|nr:CvpA family protein [Chitinophagaceae bacterium]